MVSPLDSSRDLRLQQRNRFAIASYCRVTAVAMRATLTAAGNVQELRRSSAQDGARQACFPNAPVDERSRGLRRQGPALRGRSRAYCVEGNRNAALSLPFNQRCEMVPATALVAPGAPASLQPAVLAFLNSDRMLKWAEIALGL
ncbi:hypothetical protein ACVIIV_006485 [Bradyrhizobium sp. USDA 4354]